MTFNLHFSFRSIDTYLKIHLYSNNTQLIKSANEYLRKHSFMPFYFIHNFVFFFCRNNWMNGKKKIRNATEATRGHLKSWVTVENYYDKMLFFWNLNETLITFDGTSIIYYQLGSISSKTQPEFLFFPIFFFFLNIFHHILWNAKQTASWPMRLITVL